MFRSKIPPVVPIASVSSLAFASAIGLRIDRGLSTDLSMRDMRPLSFGVRVNLAQLFLLILQTEADLGS